jgi:hypothetical protein
MLEQVSSVRSEIFDQARVLPTKRGALPMFGSSSFVFCALLDLACAPSSFNTVPVPARPNFEAQPVSVSSVRDLTWDPRTRRVACSKTGTSIQITDTSETAAISQSDDEFVARFVKTGGVVLVRTRDHEFDQKDLLTDTFDAHLLVTNHSLSQISFSDIEVNRNKGSARYREDPTNGTGPSFRFQYALASRNGASCRIAILATEGPESNPIFGTMATFRDSPWLDKPPAPYQDNRAGILAAALTIGTYVFASVPH